MMGSKSFFFKKLINKVFYDGMLSYFSPFFVNFNRSNSLVHQELVIGLHKYTRKAVDVQDIFSQKSPLKTPIRLFRTLSID
jgi:hypothetical protein